MIVENVIFTSVENKADRVVDPALDHCIVKLGTVFLREWFSGFTGIVLCEHDRGKEQHNKCPMRYCSFHIDSHVCQTIKFSGGVFAVQCNDWLENRNLSFLIQVNIDL